MKLFLFLIFALLNVSVFGQGQGVTVRALNGFGTNFSTVGCLALLTHNGITTSYSNAYTASLALAAGNDVLEVIGTHIISNAITLKASNRMVFSGGHIVSYIPQLAVNGPAVKLASYCRVENFSGVGGFRQSTTNATYPTFPDLYQAMVGAHQNAGAAATNFYVSFAPDYSGAGSDSFFIKHTNPCSGTIERPHLNGTWDNLTFQFGAHQIKILDPQVRAIGTNYIKGSGGLSTCINFDTAQGSLVQVYGGSLVVSNSGGTVIDCASSGSGALQLELYNVAITNLANGPQIYLGSNNRLYAYGCPGLFPSKINDDLNGGANVHYGDASVDTITFGGTTDDGLGPVVSKINGAVVLNAPFSQNGGTNQAITSAIPWHDANGKENELTVGSGLSLSAGGTLTATGESFWGTNAANGSVTNKGEAVLVREVSGIIPNIALLTVEGVAGLNTNLFDAISIGVKKFSIDQAGFGQAIGGYTFGANAMGGYSNQLTDARSVINGIRSETNSLYFIGTFTNGNFHVVTNMAAANSVYFLTDPASGILSVSNPAVATTKSVYGAGSSTHTNANGFTTIGKGDGGLTNSVAVNGGGTVLNNLGIVSTVASTMNVTAASGQNLNLAAGSAGIVTYAASSFGNSSNGRYLFWRNGAIRLFDLDGSTLLLSSDNTIPNALDLKLSDLIAKDTVTATNGFASYAAHTPVAVTVGASPFNFTNNNPVAIECYFSGATAYAVDKNGVAIYGSLAGDAYFVLQPSSRCAITYTVAPNMFTNAW